MPDDILDSAQKQINDAASAAAAPLPTPPPPMPTPPPEPAPEPTPPPAPAPIETPVIETPAVEQVVPPPTPEPPQPPKSGKAGKIIAGLLLLFLLISIPVGVYFNSKKQQIAEIRSNAAADPCKVCYQGHCVPSNYSPCSNSLNVCGQDSQCTASVPTEKPLPTPTKSGGGGGGGGGTPTCGANDCSGTQIPGSTSCYLPGTTMLRWCCSPGQIIANGQCGPRPTDPPNGRCSEFNPCANGYKCTEGICQPNIDCSKTGCNSNGCTAGDAYDGAGASNCVVWHYQCSNNVSPGQACLENGTVGKSATFNGCGTEQIDLYCPVCGFGGGQSGNANSFKSRFNQGSCGGGTPKKTPTPPNDQTPQCNQMKIYKGDTVVTDYSSLQVGNQIVIAVKGLLAKKAHVRINGGAWTETSTKNNKEEFTIDFTITADSIVNNKISIEGEIYGIDNKWH